MSILVYAEKNSEVTPYEMCGFGSEGTDGKGESSGQDCQEAETIPMCEL
jgi:hypothetical protein